MMTVCVRFVSRPSRFRSCRHGCRTEGSRYITLAGGDKVYFDNIGAVAGRRFRFSARHVAVRLDRRQHAASAFSPIKANTASFLTAGSRYNPALDAMQKIAAASGKAEQINSDNYQMMLAWANNLFAEVL
ncbi:hypothetical protein [Methylomonas koyamae]|uniref:hypothetical protein n=1 Tax=Methylomonas koyamae TaxID=702114 RepID=UPI00287369D5|nr:hypothetical protein [Methylomonas koyamae]WNB75106.1 hypothetical protein RI210_17740 [Methylomonas koyamae]